MGLRTLSSDIWCAASSSLIQDSLTGFLLAIVIALIAFPLEISLQRPPQGPQLSFARAKALKRRSQIVSLVLMPAYGVTIIGYLILYALAKGKGCDAALGRDQQYLTVGWAGWVLLNISLVIVAALLRLRIAVHNRTEP